MATWSDENRLKALARPGARKWILFASGRRSRASTPGNHGRRRHRNSAADAEYGGIRSELEAAAKSVGSNDRLIAAHAYATGATIVTADVEEFKRIRGLNVENC